MISEKISQRAPSFITVHAYTKSPKETYKKIISALKLPLGGIVVFIDMNMHIFTELGRSFKTFLKYNYLIVLYSCYWFTENVKHGIEHDIDSTYGDIRHSWNLQQIL